MIKRSGSLKREEKSSLQKGNGTLVFDAVLEEGSGELFGKGRLFSIITIAPGDSVGYHVHQGEMECYYILEGEGKYDDNGEETVVKKGDTTITLSGEGHSIECVGDSNLVFMALILFTE